MLTTTMVAIISFASMGIMTSNWNKFVVALVKEVKVSIAIVAIMAVFMASYEEVN